MSARSATAGRFTFCLRKAVRTAAYSLVSTWALLRNRTSRAAKYWAKPPTRSSTARRLRKKDVRRQRRDRKRAMIHRALRGAACGSCFEPVSDAPHRLDQLVLLVAELLP